MMDPERLNQLVDQFSRCHILVVGDFFLDKYLVVERRLSEISLETGLEAYQVVSVRCSPGAAGTVVNNLRALGVQVTVLGVIGDDGEGYELKRLLARQGVDVQNLWEVPGRLTPTYTKPMMVEPDGRTHELNRLDIKNRSPLPELLQAQIDERLRLLAVAVDGIIVVDQTTKADYGAITSRLRDTLAALGQTKALDRLMIAVDSRERIGLFQNVILKPNSREALAAVGRELAMEAITDQATVVAAGQALCQRTGRPVFLTMGAAGSLVFTADGMHSIPAVPVSGPIDSVGAGDSVMAGLVAALCCGATPAEAAWIGNLVASITIQQIGTTGTASPDQVKERNLKVQGEIRSNG
jgi:rfaE bifunctional protein kinase chain/domain